MFTRNTVRLCSCAYYSTKIQTQLPKENFNVAVKAAEKVVGYPTSFLNLRWLLNDEIANVASHITKLIHIQHPLIETAKGFLFKNDVPTWGLIVLLVSKTCGLNKVTDSIQIDHTAGILHSQRILAEVSEMIRTSIMIHRGLLNPTEKMEQTSDLHFGNKLALLGGDYLLSKCFNDLANIKNHDVNNLISSTLRDLTENEFLGDRDEQNFPLPSRPREQQATEINLIAPSDKGPYHINDILGHCKPEWFLRSILGGANLLGKSCEAACVLTNQDAKVQENAFLLGKYMGLIWQLKMEIETFRKKEMSNYFLVTAPVLWCLSKYPELYEKEIAVGVGKHIENCRFNKIHEFVTNVDTIEECQHVQNDLITQCHNYLDNFNDNASRQSLSDILDALKL